MQYKKHIVLNSSNDNYEKKENYDNDDYEKYDNLLDDDLDSIEKTLFSDENVLDYRTGGLEETKTIKKKRKIFAFYFINIVLFIAILIVLGFIILITVFPMKNIKVKNSTINDERVIKDYVIRKGKYEKNGLYQILINLIDKKKNIPFVENYRIKLLAPKTFEINVIEKDLLCYVKTPRKNVYFDESGVIKEISDKALENVTEAKGLKVKNQKIGKKIELNKDTLNALLNIIKSLKKYNMKVDKVDFYEKNSISIDVGDIIVDFGNIKYLDKKLIRLHSLMPKVKKYKGKFHFENWSPDYTDVVFEILKK